jgi:hypothetical protein
MAANDNPPRCRLEETLGKPGTCSGARCPFWDDAGPGACIFASLDLRGRDQLTGWLLELRRRLEIDEETTRNRFFERLNAGRSD